MYYTFALRITENVQNMKPFQGCGNTMPDLHNCLTWSHFIQDKLKIYIYLTCPGAIINKVNAIVYFIFNVLL